MANYVGCLVIQRIIFPLILTTCVLFRPAALTIPYLLLLLYLPFVPVASKKTIRGHTGCYFIFAIVISTIIVLCQIAVQIFVAVMNDNEEFLEHCEFTEYLFRHIGMLNWKRSGYVSILLWYLPDAVVFIVTIMVFVVLKKMAIGPKAPTDNLSSESVSPPNINNTKSPILDGEFSAETIFIMKQIGSFLAMISLLLAASLRPSVPGAIYFIVFLGAATWWSCYKELNRAFAIICRIVLPFLVIHVTSFLSYQTPWPQEMFPSNNTIVRFLGFSPLYMSTCNSTDNGTSITDIIYNKTVQVDSYLNPVAILLCYYTLAITSGLILNNKPCEEKRPGAFTNLENGPQHLSRQVSGPPKKISKDTWQGAADKVRDLNDVDDLIGDGPSELNERTPLMRRSMKTIKKFNRFKKRRDDSSDGDMNLDDLNREETVSADEEDYSPTVWEHIWFGLGQVRDFLFKNSYIMNNIIMMSWSIVYHSWITFIFLLWANLLWIIPNQRKNMLRCAPFVVIYAEFLLLAQYMYGMNLTEEELPSNADMSGINMAQIGFVRYEKYPCGPLLLKTLFTLAFWMTLRQRSYESKMKRQTSTLAHLAAPFQVTVGAATTELNQNAQDKKSKLVSQVGGLVKTILLKSWIWIVVLGLFMCAIYGKRMTAFRITYMALVLVFLITFQLSWRVWRKLMYGFWVVVIGFAMLTLIMIYTYQFDRFNEYWANYAGIPEKLQRDIGLVKFETKDLFIHLVNPTLVVIITVVQLQIFHKKYLESIDFINLVSSKRRNSESGIHPPSSVNYGNFQRQDTSFSEADDKSKSQKREYHFRDIKNITSKQVLDWLKKCYEKLKCFVAFMWLFLEMHSPKLILIMAFLLATNEVTVLHIIIIILATVACTARTHCQSLITRIISLVIGIMLITKMIYQIEYIDHSYNNVNCNNNSSIPNDTKIIINDANRNNANWFGFSKITDNQTLSSIINGYVWYILVTTFYQMICLREKRKRFEAGQPLMRPKVLFPSITRQNADKDLMHMVKYLMNFSFFKFGMEITLIMSVILIANRMDVVAMIYSIWLCVLFGSSREKQTKLWPIFKIFICVLIVIEYLVIVGSPPFLCINYRIWDNAYWRNFQDWGWLPDQTLRYVRSGKLILDFLLLMCVCRQYQVFRIEKQYDGSVFPGGSNKSVIDEINNMNKTPITHTHDFVSYSKDWLDICKCMLFLGFFWVTLAIVFMTGTNRVNLYSVGYLIGSFIFLWQGADFYLRPIYTILKWWKFLLGYNVLVITIKTILQIPGCIFSKELAESCWVIQLLGMTCNQNLFKKEEADYIKAYSLECSGTPSDYGLLWDGVCFTFLIIQMRMYQSYYFCHVINESKASTILASRGAELIEALRHKQVKLQAKREAEILQKIKQKMDRIKANQQKLQPKQQLPKSHYEEVRPLARTASLSSCAGYHTPIEDEMAAVSDLPSDLGRGQSFLSTQAPSPMSAILTVSLDGYLDPQRLSYGSPPGSDIAVAHGPCSEESFPVFSPLPLSEADGIAQISIVPASEGSPTRVPPPSQIDHPIAAAASATITTIADAVSAAVAGTLLTTNTQNTLQPGVHSRQHRRQSSINTVSWTDQGETSSGRGVRPLSHLGPSDETDETNVQLRRRPSHRRQSSVAISWSRFEDPSDKRRDSNASWVRDDDYDEVSARTGRSRPNSWGPIGEFYYRESLCLSETDKSLFSHQESIRSGDYYLFDDMAEKMELDLLHQQPSGNVKDTQILKRNISQKMTFEQVLTEKLKQRRQTRPTSDSSVGLLTRRSSLPDEHVSGIDPRSTLSDPIPGGEKGGPDGSKKRTGGFTQPDGQRPGPSRAPLPRPTGELSEPTDTAPEEPGPTGLALILAFLSGLLVSITLRLYKLSRNYRYIMRVLSKEKKDLKSEEDFGQGHRIGSGIAWAPMPSILRTKGKAKGSSTEAAAEVISTEQPGPSRINDTGGSSSFSSSGSEDDHNAVTQPIDEKERLQRQLESQSSKALASSDDVILELVDEDTTIAHLLRPTMFSTQKEPPKIIEEQEKERRTSIVPAIRIMAPSLERGLDDHSHKYDSDSVASLSSTTSSSSSKGISELDEDFYSQEHSIITEFFTALWFALISNTDLICYLLVFINMVTSASLLSLPMPIMVFLWGTLTVPRPSKTFWITLIAYTQVVVLVKCICQLNIIWWHADAIPPNQPMAPPRIIGIEQKRNYATYDLILLLGIFFHRFAQKQMGIWRLSSKDDSVKDGAYEAKSNMPDPDEMDVQTMIVKQGKLSVELTKTKLNENPDTIDDVPIVNVTNVPQDKNAYFPKVAALSTKKYCSMCTRFFGNLLKSVNRVTADMYVYIFLCDFINFFVLLFGFAAFGSSQGDGGVASYLEENKIPVPFLIMLLLQFVFIIVDRALYLRKNLMGKIIFQFISVVGMHLWLFFLVPVFSERSFNAKTPPIVYYLIKCLYFLLSAYQIRCGYPRRILGNCLTKNFSMFNLGAFKVYMLTPFLFELRALMDWIWTDTSMPLFEWLKMEDIFANIFELKCSRQMEKDFPAERGIAKKSLIKYVMGGGFLFAIIALVWGPLALFALGNTVGESNVPYEVSVELKIGPYEPVYRMSAQSSQIHKFSQENFTTLNRLYAKNRVAVAFLSNFEAEDVASVVLGSNSTSLWIISPPDRVRLINDLKNNVTLKVRYKYSVSRISYSEKMPGTLTAEPSYDLIETDPARTALVAMLNGTITERALMPHLFPKFLKVKNLGDLKPIQQLMPEDADLHRNVTLLMHQIGNGSDMFWQLLEYCSDSFYKETLSVLPYADCSNNLVLYTMSDKLFPANLSWATAGGVIGIYSTFVFLASRFFRGLFSGGSVNIMYSELPFVDRILQLCLDIYLVRESLEFHLEEDLFAKLIFLYRSPETMIKWTREADEQTDEDATEAVNGPGYDDDDNDDNDDDNDEAGDDQTIQKSPIKAIKN